VQAKKPQKKRKSYNDGFAGTLGPVLLKGRERQWAGSKRGSRNQTIGKNPSREEKRVSVVKEKERLGRAKKAGSSGMILGGFQFRKKGGE